MAEGRGSYKHFLEVLRKKPRIENIVKNLTLDHLPEIEKVTDIPTWMRKHVKQFVSYRDGASLTPEQIAERVGINHPPQDIRYPCYSYIGDGTEIGKLKLPVDNGDLVLILTDGSVFVNRDYARFDGTRLLSIDELSYIEEVNFTKYFIMVSEYLNKKYAGIATPMDNNLG